MVHDDGPVGLDLVRVAFDDERVVSDAGIALAATLAQRLGIEGLIDRFVLLRPDRPGARNAGRKVMTLVFAMALGADSIDDCDVLRSGRTRRLVGGWVAAPSTLGTFLRAFTFGHVRQLDRVLGETLTRAWQAGAGPGGERLVVDVDSFVGEVSHPGFDGDFDARASALVEGEVCDAESEEVPGGVVGACDAAGVRVGPPDRARRG